MTGPALLASVALIAGTMLLAAPRRAALGPPRPGGREPSRGPVPRALVAPGGSRSPLVAVLVALGTVAAGVLGVPVAAVAFLGGLVAVVGLERSRGRRRAAVLRTREQVDEALAVLGAELVAGRAPPAALASAAAAAPAVAPAAQLAALGGDPTPALQQAAGAAGAEALHGLAAAYGVASRTGAALSPVVQRLRLGLAGQAAGSREAAEQLAPVHATARVLAVLPLLGLGLGGALGVDTPALLTGTTWGQVCLLLALGLVAAGLWWVDALARRTLR